MMKIPELRSGYVYGDFRLNFRYIQFIYVVF